MSALDYQQELDAVAEDLSSYHDSVWVIKACLTEIYTKIATITNITKIKKINILSPYLNFRDALFHYKKMFDAATQKNERAFIEQRACINEHLNRGLKDLAIFMCANHYSKIVHMMIDKKAQVINADTLPALRKIYHDFKNTVVEIRIGGKHYSVLITTKRRLPIWLRL